MIEFSFEIQIKNSNYKIPTMCNDFFFSFHGFSIEDKKPGLATVSFSTIMVFTVFKHLKIKLIRNHEPSYITLRSKINGHFFLIFGNFSEDL